MTITYDEIRKEVRFLHRLDPTGKHVDFTRLWQWLNGKDTPRLMMLDTMARLVFRDGWGADSADVEGGPSQELIAQAVHVMGLAVATKGQAHPNRRRSIFKCEYKRLHPARRRHDYYSTTLGGKYVERAFLWSVAGRNWRFYYVREKAIARSLRACHEQDEAWVRFLLGGQSCTVDFDAGVASPSEFSVSFHYLKLAELAASGRSPLQYGMVPASDHDCPQMADSDRCASGYHFAYGARPTGKLTDDMGGIFECKLVAMKGRGWKSHPVVTEGVAVRYVVGNETSWGFARTVSAAAKIARSHLAKELQEVAQQPTAGVSLEGGFL